jgi:hypothetical protein
MAKKLEKDETSFPLKKRMSKGLELQTNKVELFEKIKD